MSFSRGQLRKLPILAEIHELLKRENEAGSITRQEAVSMVPPLFLDVASHHRVSAAIYTNFERALGFVLYAYTDSVLHTDIGHVCCTRVQNCTNFGDAARWDHDAHRLVAWAKSRDRQYVAFCHV